ncbi:MAG TPA: 2-phospho-L-lactate transferase CofD family protein [Solirubrobacteraceae bacterium]|nr:2-phospho-L-lactate transferase CofD family protein [Solirubrobacteraceae bacterium]
MTSTDVVVLAGGTGGAKLARGMCDAIDPERLVVIANTGDDIEIYGAHVSPDPDLVSFWLADEIDERGWGLRDDTFAVMDALRELGRDVWFSLGDRDLAWCLERARLLAGDDDERERPGADEGLGAEQGSNAGQASGAGDGPSPLTPTAALARLNATIGVRARVLPMSDDPVRTWVRTTAGWRSFQEYMIRQRAEGFVEGLEFRGAEQARASEQALAAIAQARAIVIGPSNPLASIAPILAVPGIHEALAAAAAPVVAVSPVVGGEILKGPTASFMAFAALECSADGVADFYGELLDGIVADENVARLPTLQIDTRMDDAPSRARVARETLGFVEALAG